MYPALTFSGMSSRRADANWEDAMKYVLYRSLGSIDKDVRKHELVAVEYGKDINEVTDALIT